MSTGPRSPVLPVFDATTPPLSRGPLLSSVSGVVHGFTSRAGGVSVGPLASLNLARREGESGDALRTNWVRVAHALHPDLRPEDVAIVHQVHGADVVRVSGGRGPLDALGNADALVTTATGVVLAVRVADCVPVLLWAPGGVAAAHAGWRGVVAGVVGRAVDGLCDATGAKPSDVVAAIGPHITGVSFEVGPEVVDGLRATGLPDEAFLRSSPGRRDHVDLGAAVQAQLERRGVVRVDRVPGCTFRDAEFFSHRRDGALTGRMVGAIARMG